MRRAIKVDYEWDVKIIYTLRIRTKNGIGVDAITDMGHKFQMTHSGNWRRFKKNLKHYF